jgi:hypothetical protein
MFLRFSKEHKFYFFLEGPQALLFLLLLGAAFRVKLERGGLTLTGESFKGQKSP